MLLEHFIKAILLSEGRLEIILQRFPQFRKEIERFKHEDPEGNLKYLLWQVKQLERKEPVDEIISLVKQFHTMQNKLKQKDLFKYETLGDLRFAFEALSKKEEIKIAKQDAEKIYEDERYLVVFPKTKEASCKYGMDTRWCISATESENAFYQKLVENNSVFYFIIDKARDVSSDPLGKVALQYRRDEQYNATLDSVWIANDDQLSLEQAFSSIEDEEAREKIRAAIKKHLQSKPKIKYVEKVRQAQDQSTSAEVLALLAKDQDASVRHNVAQNTSTSPEALALLAQDQDAHVRRNVAYNTSTPQKVLAVLAQDKDMYIRCNVANNTSTLPEVLAVLAQDQDASVRYYVAYNTSTPPEALTLLAQDQSANVRYNVAQNTSTPPKVLVVLAQDQDAIVRWRAKNTLQKLNTRVEESKNVLQAFINNALFI